MSSDEPQQRFTTWAHVYLCSNPLITAILIYLKKFSEKKLNQSKSSIFII